MVPAAHGLLERVAAATVPRAGSGCDLGAYGAEAAVEIGLGIGNELRTCDQGTVLACQRHGIFSLVVRWVFPPKNGPGHAQRDVIRGWTVMTIPTNGSDFRGVSHQFFHVSKRQVEWCRGRHVWPRPGVLVVVWSGHRSEEITHHGPERDIACLGPAFRRAPRSTRRHRAARSGAGRGVVARHGRGVGASQLHDGHAGLSRRVALRRRAQPNRDSC